MPYDGDKELPANVKKLSPKKQRQWRHVWNSSYAKHGDESKAFAMANGVVGHKDTDPVNETVALQATEKGYVESWQIRTISQDEAGYSPVGGGSEKACANCNWFVPSADGCALVGGDIVATGLSDFWLEKQEYHMEPMPVVIVGEKDEPSEKALKLGKTEAEPSLNVGLVDRLVGVVKQAFKPSNGLPPPAPLVQGENALLFYKNSEGRIRWFSRYSNCYKDRDHEFISTASHKEYVEWVHRTGVYPELWLWHTKGSRIGKADFVDFADGFAVASGLIDEGSEQIADRLSDGVDNLGASHGFLPLATLKNVVMQHVTFEISVLPKDRASAYGTGYDFTRIKEANMKPEQREWFKAQGVPEDMINAWETSTTEMAKAMQASGAEYKEVSEGDGTNAIGLLVQQQAIVTKATSDLAGVVGELKKSIDELKKSDDEKIAAQIEPAVTPTTNGVHVPTFDGSNVVAASKDTEPEFDDESRKLIADMFGIKV